MPGRDADAVGVAVWERIASDVYQDRVDAGFGGERGYEVYYRFQLTPWLAVTPDVQFIEDPGGKKSARDAVVLALRSRLKF